MICLLSSVQLLPRAKPTKIASCRTHTARLKAIEQMVLAGSAAGHTHRPALVALAHYGRMVVALKETLRIMAAIDAAIPAWPIP